MAGCKPDIRKKLCCYCYINVLHTTFLLLTDLLGSLLNSELLFRDLDLFLDLDLFRDLLVLLYLVLCSLLECLL